MLKVLAENRHISYIEDVFKAFQSQYNQQILLMRNLDYYVDYTEIEKL
jgi:histidyl-tRNA synthetase